MGARETSADFLEQAAVLRQILEEDPGVFDKVVTALGISRRKAYYLVEIDRTFEIFPVPRERLLRIGWTKLKVIAPGLTKTNLEARLALAEKFPAHKLRDMLTDGDADDDDIKRTVLLYLSLEDYKVFAEVLKAHGASPTPRGLKGQEEALMNALHKLQS